MIEEKQTSTLAACPPLTEELTSFLSSLRHFAWRHGEANTVRQLDGILGGTPMELLRKKSRARYGYADNGEVIVPPSGWAILPEGERVPPVHREAKEDGYWCDPRRCTSTMTPIYASVSGYVRAFAVPIVPK